MYTFKEFCENDGRDLILEAIELYSKIVESSDDNVDSAALYSDLTTILKETNTFLATVTDPSNETQVYAAADAIEQSLNTKGINVDSDQYTLNAMVKIVPDTGYLKIKESGTDFNSLIKDSDIVDAIKNINKIVEFNTDNSYLNNVIKGYLVTVCVYKVMLYIIKSVSSKVNMNSMHGFKSDVALTDKKDLTQDTYVKLIKCLNNGDIDPNKLTTGSLIPWLAGQMYGTVDNKLNAARNSSTYNAVNNTDSIDDLKENDEGEKGASVVPIDPRLTPDASAQRIDDSISFNNALKNVDFTDEEKIIVKSLFDKSMYNASSKKKDSIVSGLNMSALFNKVNSIRKSRNEEEIQYRRFPILLKSAIQKMRDYMGVNVKDNDEKELDANQSN